MKSFSILSTERTVLLKNLKFEVQILDTDQKNNFVKLSK